MQARDKMEKITNETIHTQGFKSTTKALIGFQGVDVLYNYA